MHEVMFRGIVTTQEDMDAGDRNVILQRGPKSHAAVTRESTSALEYWREAADKVKMPLDYHHKLLPRRCASNVHPNPCLSRPKPSEAENP